MQETGADAVVPVEMTSFHERKVDIELPDEVIIFSSVESGAYIRKRGEDFKRGQKHFARRA